MTSLINTEEDIKLEVYMSVRGQPSLEGQGL